MGRATPTPRPSKVPSLRYSSRTRLRTGECSAAQSIFLCPSGARPGSLTMDPLCMVCASLPRPPGAHLFLCGLHLLPPAEHEAGDDYEDEERYQADPYAHGPG